MVEIKVETKNKVDIDKKPRVYFTCHPEDFDKYFKKVCEDIFKTHDCAIYYTEDMTERIEDGDKETFLGRSNLFVIPVTFKLLSTPNRAMDVDYPYAAEQKIPVLPIMMESGLDDLYARADRFGERQYLSPFSGDLTEISYGEKLKKFLESVLISEEMAMRVRAAFDAYVFLSYRKKDRRYANELMRMIHANPECRDIAIWFDEFLTPGESFRENIEKILDDCNLFTLLVTPSILEKVTDENGNERDNYVVSTELPIARRKKAENGTEILAVEMEKTDGEGLAVIGVTDCVKREDSAFRNRLLASITKLAVTANDTPEHNFLIGLAYLEGIDVEVDRERAVEMITDAAENGLPEAMEKLYRMYDEGIGVALDYRKAVVWAEAYANYAVKNYGDNAAETLTAFSVLANAYGKVGDFLKALEISKDNYTAKRDVLGEEHPYTLNALDNLAAACVAVGDHAMALELGERAYLLFSKTLGEEHPDTIIALDNLAGACSASGEYDKALKYHEKAYALMCKAFGEEHPDTVIALNNLALTYGRLGDHGRALELKKQAYELNCRTLGEEHPNTLLALHNTAYTHCEMGNYREAVRLQETVCRLRSKVLGDGHPETLTSLCNLASVYSELNDLRSAFATYNDVLERSVKVLGDWHELTLKAIIGVACIYNVSGEHEKAFDLFEKAHCISLKIYGEKHETTVELESLLDELHDAVFYDEW